MTVTLSDKTQKVLFSIDATVPSFWGMDFLGGYDILITRPTLFSCTNSSATQHLETIWYFICDTSKIDSIPPNVGAACMMRMRMHGSLLVCTSTRSVIFEEHATVVRKGLSR